MHAERGIFCYNLWGRVPRCKGRWGRGGRGGDGDERREARVERKQSKRAQSALKLVKRGPITSTCRSHI